MKKNWIVTFLIVCSVFALSLSTSDKAEARKKDRNIPKAEYHKMNNAAKRQNARDIRDYKQHKREHFKNAGHKPNWDKIEDRLDRREDRRDRREDIRDKREDRHDRLEDIHDRRH